MTVKNLDNEDFCYLTTTGRVSGRPREIEIWFALQGNTLYMLSGGRDRSDWVKNIQRHPEVKVRIGRHEFAGVGRIVPAGDEDQFARRILLEKYRPRDDSDLDEWGRTALPVAVDLRDE